MAQKASKRSRNGASFFFHLCFSGKVHWCWVRVVTVVLKGFVADTTCGKNLALRCLLVLQCALTRDAWSGGNTGGLSSNNLLAVIARHFFFIVSFPRARVVTTHHLLHWVIQVHKAVGRVLCESCFVIFF